jgi:ribose transport system ATP-binding protein
LTGSEVLSLKGISKAFPGTVALDRVDFSLNVGEVHGLVGENGAGKSTLMNIINGSMQPDSGQVFIRGKAVEISSPHVAQQLGISMVHQELKLFPDLSVAENVFFGVQSDHRLFVDWPRLYARTRVVLDRLAVSFGPRKKVRNLSVAHQQQVEIAKALSRDCAILILDEPTASLTLDETEILFEVIRSVVKDGISVIYISHRLEEVFRICDRLTVLRDGKKINTLACTETSRDDIVRMMIGRSTSLLVPDEAAAAKPEEVVLEVEALTLKGKINEVSFKLHKGEILGIAGLMGSGRTELLQALAGAARIDGGRMIVRGASIVPTSPKQAIQAGIALMPEDRKKQGLILGMSVKHNIWFASLKKIFRYGFLRRGQEKQVARKMVDELGIRVDSVEKPVAFLSGGNQQKVVFAKWLLANTDILLLDEPTRGIDVGAKEEVFRVIRNLAAQGKSVIFVSSELHEILRISDRIIVLHGKRVVAELPRGADIGELIQYATGVRQA